MSKLLIPASRQYCHNNGKGFVAGYDKELTDEIVFILERKLKNAMEVSLMLALIAGTGRTS